MSNIRLNIQDFIRDLSDIPVSDQLVSLPNLGSNLVEFSSFPSVKQTVLSSSSVKAMVKTAMQFRKESDVNSLCLIHTVFHWRFKNQPILTPLFLIPVDWTVARLTGDLTFEPQLENAQLNPFVLQLVQKWTDAPLPLFENEESLDDQLTKFTRFCAENQFDCQFEPRFILGNFHYHRYHILRELEGIAKSEIRSSLLESVLGEATSLKETWSLPPDLLSPTDSNQLEVFRLFESGNVVVQGPPGTGKSQVLTNLLGKLLHTRRKTLVVSEKKVALEVLVKKLSEAGLESFAFVVHSQTTSRHFIQHLNQTWLMLEEMSAKDIRSLRLSEQRHAQLQFLLDRLNSSETFGGVTFEKFQALCAETPCENALFISDVPNISHWLDWKPMVKQLEENIGSLYVLSAFKPVFFSLENGDQLLNEVANQLAELSNLLEEGTAAELRVLYQSLGRCQLVENELYQTYTTLLSKQREWKRFEKNKDLLISLTKQMKQLEGEIQTWKTPPSASQLASWKKATGFWEKRKRKKAIFQLLSDKSVDVEIALENWEKVVAIEQDFHKIQDYFRSIGLEPNPVILESHKLYIQQLQETSSSMLSEVTTWPQKKRLLIIENREIITNLVKLLGNYFELDGTTRLEGFIQRKKQEFVSILPHWSVLKNLPVQFYRLVKIADSVTDLQAIILHSNWKMIESRFPELAKFNGKQLSIKLETLIAEEDLEMQLFAQQLIQTQKQRFDANEALIRKDPAKCSPDEKNRRSRLKRGKSLLVKEFGKTRTHQSMRELLASDAQWWIQDLIPIWLATPAQVADHFPLKVDLFDAVIFDEASQIPLPNALGALYRSHRALIAGDEQQMSPTTFFGKNWAGHDLLHQATFYFQRTALKHHYRSEHVALIDFSNRHFYANELVVYPSSKQKQAVFRHFVPNAHFIDRKNIKEAQALVAYLEQIDWEQSIGIVAFSEEQLKMIWESSSVTLQQKITQKLEENTLFFKTVEQVQGDEADCLLVSFGYAKNEVGEFHLRFGPLNLVNGYKRLNVLLTRAIKEMHFFCSVEANEFGISTNESVNLLRRYLTDLETKKDVQTVHFPYQLTPQMLDIHACSFPNIYSKLTNATDLVTFHRVMVRRGWDVHY